MPTPPPKTIRQILVEAVIAQLRLISVSNGYQTELGAGQIEEWPTQFDQEELAALATKTALGVFDLVNTQSQEDHSSRQVKNELPMQIRGFHAREVTPATLRVMIADVQKAIAAGGAIGWPSNGKRLVWWTEPKSDGFIIPKESFEVDGFAVEFTLHYLSLPFNAYQ